MAERKEKVFGIVLRNSQHSKKWYSQFPVSALSLICSISAFCDLNLINYDIKLWDESVSQKCCLLNWSDFQEYVIQLFSSFFFTKADIKIWCETLTWFSFDSLQYFFERFKSFLFLYFFPEQLIFTYHSIFTNYIWSLYKFNKSYYNEAMCVWIIFAM